MYALPAEGGLVGAAIAEYWLIWLVWISVFGKRAGSIIPEVMLFADVVSIVALGASPLMSEAEG
jgi:hypothetical protein